MAQENQENVGTEPKMFTQEELDAIIEKRLARAKTDDNPKVAELEAELARIKEADAERVRKQLEEQGKYKEINQTLSQQLAEVKSKADKVDSYNELLEQTAAAIIEEIPEDLRTLVPDVEISKKLNWLRTNRAKLIKPIAPNITGRQGAGGPAKEIDLTIEEREMARKFGMSDEEYAKYKK